MASNIPGRRVRTLAFAGVAVVIVALALGYASRRALNATPAAPMEKLSIALPLAPHAALLHIATAKGYLAEEGLDVTITPVSHGKAAMDLLEQGKADLAFTAEVPFVISVLQGQRVEIAATVVSVANAMAVVARRDRGIKAPRDLLGKRIGVTLGTSGEYCLWAFLVWHKLAPDSVTLVDLPPGQMVQELASGTIDAVSTWEPIKSNVRAALADNALTFTEPDAYTGTYVVAGPSELLKARGAALEKLVRALLKAEAFNQSEPQQALALVAGQLKRDVKALEPGWKDFAFKVDLHQSLLVTLEDEAQWAMARGYAARGPVPNFLPHLHLATLLAVQPERVTVVH